MGIHLGSGAYRSLVSGNRSNHNGQSRIYLCWRVQHGIFKDNECWANADGISIGPRTLKSFNSSPVITGNAFETLLGFLTEKLISTWYLRRSASSQTGSHEGCLLDSI